MPTYVPPKKNTAFVTYVSLVSQTTPNTFQANPTLAAGDVKVAIDDGAPANIATLPEVDADLTKRVKVSLSASEMNGDNVSIIFSDAAGAEWSDMITNIQTSSNQINDLALASVCTEARLSELDPANLPTDVDFVKKWINNKLVESPAGTWKLYDDDNTTVLKTWTWDSGTTTRSKAT